MAEKNFDPDAYLAEEEAEFNPDEYLAEQTTEESLMQPISSFTAKGLNTLTGGYLPQIMGGVKSALTEVPYVDARDQAIQMLGEQEQRDPLSSGLGSVAGIAGQMAIPSGRIAKGIESMSIPAKAATQTGINLGQMALQNPGDVEGEVSPLQLKERSQNFKDPVAMSLAALPAAVTGIGNLAKKASNKFDETIHAFKAGMPSTKIFRERLGDTGQKDMKNIGKFMLDEKLVTPTSTIDDIYYRSKEKLKEYGEQSKAIYEKSAKTIEKHLANTPQDANDYLEKGLDIENKRPEILKEISDVLKASPEKETALKKASDYLDQIEQEVGPGSVPDINYLHKAKQELQSQINFLKQNKELPDTQRAYKLLLKRVQDGIDNELNYFDKIVGGNEAKKLRDLDRKLTNLYVVKDMSERGFAKSETRGLGLASSLGAMGGLGYGLSTGDPLKTAVGMAIGATAVPLVQKGVGAVGDVMPSMKASALNKINNMPESRAFSAPLRGYLGQQTMNNDERIGGFPMRMTIPVFPEEIQTFEQEVIGNPRLNNTEKAKRLNLIRNDKRVYIGQ